MPRRYKRLLCMVVHKIAYQHMVLMPIQDIAEDIHDLLRRKSKRQTTTMLSTME